MLIEVGGVQQLGHTVPNTVDTIFSILDKLKPRPVSEYSYLWQQRSRLMQAN
jgi:hypothetical protein